MTMELNDLLHELNDQRRTFRVTVRGLTAEEAVKRTTVSELTLGGLLKHLTLCERSWTHILTEQPGTPPGMLDWDQYTWTGDDFDALLKSYDEAVRTTDEAVRTASLDKLVPLPSAPWDQNPQPMSIRRIVLHLIRETAQHAGHADIIRETLDGQSTTAFLYE
ncbi:DinB family protein [Lentzea sp. NBC_00516]|uniref:DinB family protein n=1 Tax=Lentzea sp. NBC_00516 TaxID=2903582 RepID=UPI002E8120AB|nr:DinB family protein [Lentzea sp. NBC_00516]WUD29028.1 DinB family protein [Lentzea sp. NBC_00516]